jgi:outer membrane protein insertion porin family
LLPLVALLALGLAPARAQAQSLDAGQLQLKPLDAPLELNDTSNTITAIQVEGARRTEPDAIRRVLRNKVGQTFDAGLTADDLKAVWALHYFTDVQLFVNHTPKGIVYVVRVQERPVVRSVKMEGLEELS